MIVVRRHLPVIGAGQAIITTGRVAIVIARRRVAGVMERAQICTITTAARIIVVDGNWGQRGMRMLSANHVLLKVWIVVVVVVVLLLLVCHHQIVRFFGAESTVLVRILGFDVARESAEERL